MSFFSFFLFLFTCLLVSASPHSKQAPRGWVDRKQVDPAPDLDAPGPPLKTSALRRPGRVSDDVPQPSHGTDGSQGGWYPDQIFDSHVAFISSNEGGSKRAEQKRRV